MVESDTQTPEPQGEGPVPGREYEGLLPDEIAYVDEQGKPEEPLSSRKEVEPPPEADDAPSLPVEEPDDETPPDDAVPSFIVTPMRGRPPRITLADGTPVGVWLAAEYPDADGGFVAEQLIVMGMDGELAAWFGIQRDKAREATAQMMTDPNVRAFAQEEAAREARMDPIREAFIKSKGSKT